MRLRESVHWKTVDIRPRRRQRTSVNTIFSWTRHDARPSAGAPCGPIDRSTSFIAAVASAAAAAAA